MLAFVLPKRSGKYVSLITPKSARGLNLAVTVKRPGERRSLSRSATRALDVMELFGAERRALRAVEIGSALGINPSTANQLLKTLVDSGHLVFDARPKTYLPSPRLAAFSSWMVDAYGAGGQLRDLMHDLQERLDMVVTASTPNDLFMQIIDSAIPEGRTAERGLRVSLFGSAIGSAYLSMLDDAEIARLAHRARIPGTEAQDIIAKLAAIRNDGYADGPSADGKIWSVAVPLPAKGLHAQTVLGLAGPAETVRERAAELAASMHSAIRNRLQIRESGQGN
jgi:DNA-binding IclR family transcriptional regulator